MFFKNHGILGINARNLLYIKPYNPKKAIKLADDKIKTKQFLAARGIPVPKLYGIIKSNNEIEKYDFNSLPSSFVIKPNQGYGGEGIIPIVSKRGENWVTAGGKLISKEEIKSHIADIIDGRYSITNSSDCAFFEQYIISDDRVGKYSYAGLPDIRVVVHNLIPVMAMLRLPTRESNGKANLHQGAVGVGIDIAKGEATHITYRGRIIEELPDNLGKIRGVKIPYWDDILLISSKIQLTTNLGYMAVDISIDKNTGPVLLEINARAGLSVQIANLAPLRKRLERIQGVKVTSPTKGVRIAKDMFGNTIEKEIAHISGKQIISTEEEIEIIQKQGIIKTIAKIDTGRSRSTIDKDFAKKIGLLNSTEYNEEKQRVKAKISIKNKRIQTILDLEEATIPENKVTLGSRDLSDFLIAPAPKKKEEESPKILPQDNEIFLIRKVNYQEVDKAITEIEDHIKLIHHLNPVNLTEEKEKFLASKTYNPQFEYIKLKFDPIELIDRLHKINTDGTPLGLIFQAKKEEVSKKIALLESIDDIYFTQRSTALFSKPTEEEVKHALKLIQTKTPKNTDKIHYLTIEEVKEEFEKTLATYNLSHWKVKIKESMVADCLAGKQNTIFLKKTAEISKKRLHSLIVHEIETHVLTAENGKKQPYDIFNRGTANYLVTQEGLAMYNTCEQCGPPFSYRKKPMIQIIAIDYAISHSFRETYDYLRKLGCKVHEAFRATTKAKRGLCDTGKKGAFTKDYVYYKGYYQVENFVNNGGSLSELYLGKINLEDLEKAQKVKGIIKPTLLPKWLSSK